ncbi:MAG: PLxRFG domain-containing protein [Deltaproteobacteria bacterium]|nr:MAG: PLxRFG domain-containing protein [Deltaproteobacteria bacterium]
MGFVIEEPLTGPYQGLDPNMLKPLQGLAEDYYALYGESLRLTSGRRTREEQARLYQEKPHLAAKPGHSKHEEGQAGDVDEQQIARLEADGHLEGLLKKHGLHRPVLHKGETWHLEPRFVFEEGESGAQPENSGPMVNGRFVIEEEPFPTDATADTLAQFSGAAGEMVGQAIDAPFIPLRKGLEKVHQYLIEPSRQRTLEEWGAALQEGVGAAAPEAFAALPAKEAFVSTLEFALAPAYLRLIGKGAQLLKAVGKGAFYKHAPEWMFPKGEAGLPVPLSSEEIAQRLYAMSGTERAEMARKYPQFREVLEEMNRGGAKEAPAPPAAAPAPAPGLSPEAQAREMEVFAQESAEYRNPNLEWPPRPDAWQDPEILGGGEKLGPVGPKAGEEVFPEWTERASPRGAPINYKSGESAGKAANWINRNRPNLEARAKETPEGWRVEVRSRGAQSPPAPPTRFVSTTGEVLEVGERGWEEVSPGVSISRMPPERAAGGRWEMEAPEADIIPRVPPARRVAGQGEAAGKISEGGRTGAELEEMAQTRPWELTEKEYVQAAINRTVRNMGKSPTAAAIETVRKNYRYVRAGAIRRGRTVAAEGEGPGPGEKVEEWQPDIKALSQNLIDAIEAHYGLEGALSSKLWANAKGKKGYIPGLISNEYLALRKAIRLAEGKSPALDKLVQRALQEVAGPEKPLDKTENIPTVEAREPAAPQEVPKDVAVRPEEGARDGQAGPGRKGPADVPRVAGSWEASGVPGEPLPGDAGGLRPRGGDGGDLRPGAGGRGLPDDAAAGLPGHQQPGRADAGDLARIQRPPDYQPAVGEIKRPGSWKETARQNLDIIELAKKLEAEGRPATPAEQRLLAQYTGWGATEIAGGLFGNYYRGSLNTHQYGAKQSWNALIERAKKLLTPEELGLAAQSTQYAHYTSEKVIRSIYRALERMGFPGGKVLEPGMGTGLFGALMPDAMKKASSYTGVERDRLTALIAKKLLPRQNVLAADYIDLTLPDNFFDLAIGNPPFAGTIVTADPRYAKHRFKLHDYFFAKTLDKVRPGGLLAFVTSRYTLDKAGDQARKYLAARADFLGAIRLPQTAFLENAGTEVVTDVIFLRKRGEGEAPGGLPWQDLKEVQTPQGAAKINEYFAAHPEMVLGKNALTGTMYKAGEYTVEPLKGNIEDHFAAAVERLPENVYSIVKQTPAAQQAVVREADFNPKVQKEGNIYLSDAGELMVVEAGVGKSLEAVRAKNQAGFRKLTAAEKNWLKDYVPLRDALKQSQYDQLTDGDWEQSLEALNAAYDAFVKKHGPIRAFTTIDRKARDAAGNEIVVPQKRFKNRALWNVDVEGVLLPVLERITESGKIVKGAALTRRVIQKPERIQPATPFEALAVTLDETGRLDLEAIGQKINLPREEVIAALGNSIYQTPAGVWRMADEYLSGDVVAKLEEAEAAARIDPRWQRNVEALREVQPKALTPAEITVQLGAPWVPPEHVESFAAEVLGIDVPVSFDRTTFLWTVGAQTRGYGRALRRGEARSATSDWGTADRSPGEILTAVLNNQPLRVTRTDQDKKTFVDQAATAQVNEIAGKMRQRFATWIWSDAARAGELLDLYNRRYNNLAPRRFDGSHLTLPGFTSRITPYDHQKRAIWRIIQTGNTYLYHSVGAGKTIEMIAAGMEMKRMGLIAKPMYAVPNHMLEQFSREFLQAYPRANIMVADEENFHTQNRKKFMAQAKLNDPDAIIVTHSALGLLGMQPENIAQVLKEFKGDLEDTLQALKEERQENRHLIKQTEKRLEQLEQRFKSLIGDKDKAFTFEEMGVDFLFVDEAHLFRKLDFTSNRKVKGVDPEGSRRALDLYVKSRWLERQRPGRSHVFASGTPVTNTMAELYTIQRFFDEAGLEKDGINYFDGWANMFGLVASDLEKNAAGAYEMVERFAKFSNIPELMKRVRQFMDVLTPSQLGAFVKLPRIRGGMPELEIAPASEALKHYQDQVLKPRIDESRNWRPSPGEPGNPDPIINIITDGRLASIDLRFVGSYGNDPGSKLNKMADNIVKYYHQFKGLEYADKESGQPEPVKGATQIVFYNHGFGRQVAANRGFDARKFLTHRLQAGGIPAQEIVWIEDLPTAAAKEAVFQELRRGSKKILIGSAKKMGTGLNVQKRLKVEHYLDPPWYPADVEQPDGRIIRPGNQNEEVIILRYATKGSYDSTMWQMVARKSRFIEQAFNGDDAIRTIEDISEASQYQMVAAVTSGDARLVQLAGLQAEVEKYSRLYEAHWREQRNLESKKRQQISKVGYEEKRLRELQEAAQKAPGYVREIEGQVGGRAFDNRREMGEALIDAFNRNLQAQVAAVSGTKSEVGEKKIPLGELNGQKITGQFSIQGLPAGGANVLDAKLLLEITDKVRYPIEAVQFAQALPEALRPAGLIDRMVNQINRVGSEAGSQAQQVRNSQAELAQIERKLGAPFEYEQVLNEKIADAHRLQAELAAEGQEPPSPEVGASIAEGLQAEGRTTQRTGPTIETALRRPSPVPEPDFFEGLAPEADPVIGEDGRIKYLHSGGPDTAQLARNMEKVLWRTLAHLGIKPSRQGLKDRMGKAVPAGWMPRGKVFLDFIDYVYFPKTMARKYPEVIGPDYRGDIEAEDVMANHRYEIWGEKRLRPYFKELSGAERKRVHAVALKLDRIAEAKTRQRYEEEILEQGAQWFQEKYGLTAKEAEAALGLFDAYRYVRLEILKSLKERTAQTGREFGLNEKTSREFAEDVLERDLVGDYYPLYYAIEKYLPGQGEKLYDALTRQRENFRFWSRERHLYMYPHTRWGPYWAYVWETGTGADGKDKLLWAGARESIAAGEKMLAALKKEFTGETMRIELARKEKIPMEIYNNVEMPGIAAIIELARNSFEEEAWLKFVQAEQAFFASKGWGAHKIERKDIPGFETEDDKRVIADYFEGWIGMQGKAHRARAFTESWKGIKKMPGGDKMGLLRWKQNYQNYLLEHPREATKVRTLLYHLYLGGSMGFRVLHGLHALQTAWPEMRTISKRPGAALVRAIRDRAQLLAFENGWSQTPGLTGEEQAALEQGRRRAALSTDYTAEMAARSGSPLYRSLNNEPQGVAAKLKRAFDLVYYPTALDRGTREAIFLAAVRELRPKKGPIPESVIDRAVEVVHNSMYRYARGERPAFARRKWVLPTVFQTWSMKYFQQIFRYLRESNYHALRLLLLAAGLVGGLNALGVKDALTLAYRKIYGRDAEKDARKYLQTILGEVPGEALNRIIFRGLPAGVLGFDLSERMVHHLPWNYFFGLLEKPWQIAGAVTGPFESVARAGKALSENRPGRAVEAVAPTWLRNPLAAARLYQEGPTTLSGRRILGTDFKQHPASLGEAGRKAVGLQPTRLSEEQSYHKTVKHLQESQAAKVRDLSSRFVQAIHDKDRAGRQEVLAELKEYNRQMRAAGRYADMILPSQFRAAVQIRLRPVLPEKSASRTALRERR